MDIQQLVRFYCYCTYHMTGRHTATKTEMAEMEGALLVESALWRKQEEKRFPPPLLFHGGRPQSPPWHSLLGLGMCARPCRPGPRESGLKDDRSSRVEKKKKGVSTRRVFSFRSLHRPHFIEFEQGRTGSFFYVACSLTRTHVGFMCIFPS